jgi:hypothetical protein
MAATVQTDKQSDLVSGTPFDLASSQSGTRKSRVPEILVGTFLVAAFALAGAWFYSTSTASTPYAVLRLDIERGSVLTGQHLTVVELSSDTQIRAIKASEVSSIIGELALVDLKKDSLLTAEQFAAAAPIADGYGLVGLQLSPSEMPSMSLQTGDRVRVLLLPEGDVELTAGVVEVVEDSVEVVEVVGESGAGRFVSLSMPAELADVVAAGHANDRVRIVQVPRGADG